MAKENEKEAAKANEIYDSLAQVNVLSEMFPELAEEAEFSGLADTIKKAASTDKPKKDEDDLTDSVSDEEEYDDSEETEDEEGVEDEEEDDAEEDEDEDDVFGSSKKVKSVEVPFAFDEKAKDFIKKKYSIGEESKFFGSVDKWRNDSQKLTDVQEEKAELLEALASLPDNLKASINAFASGADYNEAFGSVNRFDFNRDFDDHKKDDIVNYYFPDKYKSIIKKLDEDDITEDVADERINDLADAAKALYKKDRKSIEDKRADLIRQEQVKTKKVKESVVSSVKNLEKQFPNFNSAEKQRIRQILVNGDTDSIFRNKDGSYKDDAALRLANALHYEKLNKRSASVAKNQGITEANLEIVNKSKKKLDKGKSSSAMQKEQVANKAVEHLSSHFNKDPYE